MWANFKCNLIDTPSKSLKKKLRNLQKTSKYVSKGQKKCRKNTGKIRKKYQF